MLCFVLINSILLNLLCVSFKEKKRKKESSSADLIRNSPLMERHETVPSVHLHVQHPVDLSPDLGSAAKHVLPLHAAAQDVPEVRHRLHPQLPRGRIANLLGGDLVNDDKDVEVAAVEERGDEDGAEELEGVVVQHLPSPTVVCKGR